MDRDDIEKLLTGEKKRELRVEYAIEGIIEPFTALALTKSADYSDVKNILAEKYTKEHKLVYITLNASAKKLERDFKKYNIDTKNILFVDFTPSSGKSNPDNEKNVLYSGSPSNLTRGLIQINNHLDSVLGEKSFVIFDSLSTLTIYNEAQDIERFLHMLMKKIEENKLSAIILSGDYDERESMTRTVAHFFDRILRV